MVSSITSGLKVIVQTQYQPAYSNPMQENFVFSYHIQIENNSENTVQLLRRHWLIYDSDGTVREVEGEGVVGQQPILEPNEGFRYTSGCNLKTSIGKMAGTYLIERLLDGKQFYIEIPEFTLVAPYRLN